MRIPTGAWVTAGLVTSAALMAVGGVLVASASPASADIISDGGVLSLDAVPGALSNTTMEPGDHIYWPISAQLNAGTSGSLSLKVTSSEALATDPQGLQLELASCPVAWTIPADDTTPPTCNGGSGTVVLPQTAFADISSSKVWHLGEMSAVSTMPMIATISLPSVMPSTLQGSNATMSFAFTALGDTENASPSDPTKPGAPELGYTGINATGPALLGLGLLLAGVILGRLRSVAGRRSRQRSDGAVPA